jgi:hypothetical protein
MIGDMLSCFALNLCEEDEQQVPHESEGPPHVNAIEEPPRALQNVSLLPRLVVGAESEIFCEFRLWS